MEIGQRPIASMFPKYRNGLGQSMKQEVWWLVAPPDLVEVVNVSVQKQVDLVLG